MLYACKKDEPLPANPYDNIDYDDSTANQLPLDSNSFQYVHTKVLAARCALPGCHDGNFEPDFRSVQSSYSTLVYHPITKNNIANEFIYRVIPFDTTHSVLYERITNCCFVNQNDRMPQDDIGIPLPDKDINTIARWIMNGARDIYGNLPLFPNSEPNVEGFISTSTNYQTIYSNNRIDSVYYNSFIVPQNVSQFLVGVLVTDDSTAMAQLPYNKLKISTDPDNFTGATEITPIYFSAGSNSFWVATINTAGIPVNTTMYMRYYVNDGDHAQNTEFPRTESIIQYKTYWSFQIQ
jgi:hypothetical protein